MSIAHSALPRTAANAMPLAAAGFVTQSLYTLRDNAMALISVLADLAMRNTGDDPQLEKLFRLAARNDTVSPQVLGLLRKMA